MAPEFQKAIRLHWIGIAVLGALCVWLALNNVLINIRISLAREQTAIFDDMRESLEKSADPMQQVEFLESAVGYYPSGTKQVAGSSLDRIVERARQNAVRDMITTLRARTGEDFGDDPKQWIEGLKKAELR